MIFNKQKKHNCIGILMSFLLFIILSCGKKNDLNIISDLKNKSGISEELSNQHINCFEEDKFGYIWIGTSRGLNRYNSYDYHQYFSISGDSTTLNSNIIKSLFNDTKDQLWIGTSNGIALYDFKMDSFHRIKIDGPEKNTKQILESEDGRIFASMYTSLYEYVPRKKEFKKVLEFDSDVFYTTCVMDKHNRLWLISASYIKCYNLSDLKQIHYIDLSKYKASNYSCFLNNSNELFLSMDNSIYSIDINNTEPTLVKRINIPSHSIVNSILAYNSNSLIIGTKTEETFIYNTLSNLITGTDDKEFPLTAPEAPVNTSFIDSNQNLWVSVLDQGYTINYKNKQQLNINTKLKSLINNKSVTAITTDKKQNLWISTSFNYEIIIYNPVNEKINQIDLKKTFRKDQLQDAISKIYADSENHIWLLISNKLYKCNYDNNQLNIIETFSFPMTLQSIAEDKFGTLWVGGYSEYIYALKKSEHEFSKIKLYTKQYTYIQDILVLSTGNLVISSFNQEFKIIDTDTWNVRSFEVSVQGLKTPAFMPSCIFEDSNQTIWLGTLNQGLFSYSMRTKKVQSYNNLLSSEEVNSIEEDIYGNIWVGTSYGLNKIYKNKQSAVSYFSYDGIGGNQFNRQAASSLSNSILFFGGTHGLTIFNLTKPNNKKKIPLYFENLIINNEIEEVSSSGVLQKNLLFSPKIDLKPNQDIEITFAGLDFNESHKVRYYYKMEGYDKDWIDSKYKRIASYPHLPSGSYIFKIKIADTENIHTETEASLPITMEKVIWLKWPMIFLYLSLIIILLFIFNYLFHDARSSKNEVITAHKEKEYERHINKMNMKFFSNMAKELRTPLTMMSGPVTILSENNLPQENRKELLTLIKTSIQRMFRLTGQIHDFNKLEENELKLVKWNENIVELINDILSIYMVSAQKREITITTIGFSIPIIISIDKEKFERILENILSNAFKFTPDRGKIEITLEIITKNIVQEIFPNNNDYIYPEYLRISVGDSGPGIPENMLEDIFKRNFKIDNSFYNIKNTGTGIGLYYAKKLIELHNGFIKAENKEKFGSILSVAFPYYKENLAFIAENQGINHEELNNLNNEDEELEVDDKSHKNITILIIDNDKDLTHYLYTILSIYYTVILKNSTDEASKLLPENKPDLIICDVLLPESDGYKFIEKLKANESYQHIPIILLSVKTLIENQIYGLNLGANAYITKPFNPLYLLSVIRSLINNRNYIRHPMNNITLKKELDMDSISVLDRAFLDNLYQLMDKELSNSELNIEQIAKLLGMSRVKFFYKVKGLTGIAPNNFFKAYKLNRAAEYLKEGKYNISEIANLTGFKTLSHFSSSFKKQFGAPPTEYK
ncbi:two-component regulator propeller domain-containing protein [Apibacter raozihei]|uniref:hybrid sensor histidine kinase/response regulator transcription factor n=1 Tax=Apibacter raozihei TaxID=2500547 RepID=UPI000FE2E9DF|nr:hybrid sensor histidine kinase/response regulator transcription factor [Apibacter raozihei]